MANEQTGIPENAIDIGFIQTLHQYNIDDLQDNLMFACLRTFASLYGQACDESPIPPTKNSTLAMMDIETIHGRFVLTIEHKESTK